MEKPRAVFKFDPGPVHFFLHCVSLLSHIAVAFKGCPSFGTLLMPLSELCILEFILGMAQPNLAQDLGWVLSDCSEGHSDSIEDGFNGEILIQQASIATSWFTRSQLKKKKKRKKKNNNNKKYCSSFFFLVINKGKTNIALQVIFYHVQ